jgi:predicted dehydrogenase
MNVIEQLSPMAANTRSPRIGFLGVGWIGRNRMESIAKAGLVQIAGIADPVEELRRKAGEIAPGADLVDDFEDLLALDLDGVVVATPSALHATQALQAIESGLAVFCQKPLGRSAAETRAVIDAARRKNVLLAVDLSYRFMTEANRVCELVRAGALGSIYAADLVFHNAYGPDKQWFYDRKLSGGGCVIDLAIHLVDLALWALNFPAVEHVSSRLYSHGLPLQSFDQQVEDFAIARLDLSTGASVQLACSWKLPAGQDAVISGTFYGTEGAARFCNINGSFFDFIAERFHGTQRELLAQSSESWGGKAAVDWATRLATGQNYDPSVESLIAVAETLDRIYEA